MLEECQTTADQTSLVVIGIPLCVAAIWVAYLLRPIPKSLLANDEIFEDPVTGVVFQGDEGQRPERDAKVACCPITHLAHSSVGRTCFQSYRIHAMARRF